MFPDDIPVEPTKTNPESSVDWIEALIKSDAFKKRVRRDTNVAG